MQYPKTKQTHQAVKEHYDTIDPFYRKIWGEHVHHGFWETGKESPLEAVEKLVDLVAEKGEVFSNAKVCDIGCGYGATARLFVKKWQAEVTALTISSSQYKYATSIKPKSKNPIYLLSDWFENDQPSNHFDMAISIESSEHMRDKKFFFKEAFRVLKPGGKIVVCAWLAKKDPKKWEIRHFLEPICREGRLPSLGSKEDYLELLQETGFENIQFEDISSKVRKTWVICLKRALKSLLTDKNLRKFLFRKKSKDRIFIKTLPRMIGAYYLKSLKYGIFSARKP